MPLDSGSKSSVALSGLSECRREVTDLAAEGREDELSVSVQEGKVRFTHRGALFNCCLDSVSLQLCKYGSILRVVETPHVNQPCRCNCTFDVQGELLELESGQYWLEVAPSPDGDCAWCRVQINVR
ncbi:hypothetical protein LLH00_03110 [bacterium]|nr:hypothetical protein [bacterium]